MVKKLGVISTQTSLAERHAFDENATQTSFIKLPEQKAEVIEIEDSAEDESYQEPR